MRKILIILIVLFGMFLAIGCAGQKEKAPNETGTPEQAVTPVEAITEAVKETPVTEITHTEAVTPTGGNATGEKAIERQNTTEMQKVTNKSEMKEYTLEELAKYNGKNGKTYVVYQGNVYDVSDSDLWKNGTHNGHNAGKDLTEEMNKSPHRPEIIKGFPVVGTLKK
ncbi:cytochrome b5 domain-containing protein [Methanosarcina sp. UBA5]|uniref:cytochrome b5 domain-containing protein n=1 Tax=Methanosarcina sp. UBA5 TaxID=1915593 RepID=UPI0032E4BA6B